MTIRTHFLTENDLAGLEDSLATIHAKTDWSRYNGDVAFKDAWKQVREVLSEMRFPTPLACEKITEEQ